MLDEKTLALRRGRITSSLAGACLGVDDRKSPIQAWLEIRGESTFAGNKMTERGNRLEGTIFEYGAQVIGAYEWRIPPFCVHPDAPWAGDSCDVTYHDEWAEIIAVGEGKSVGPHSIVEWGEEGTDEVPERVRVQADWHLWHYPKAPYCAVPIVGGHDFTYRFYRINRNPERIRLLVQALNIWHQRHITQGERPPVTAADTDYLNALRQDVPDELYPYDDNVAQIIHDAIEAKKRASDCDKVAALAANRVREMLSNFAGVKGPDFSISYRRNKDSIKTDWERLAVHLGATPELISQFKKVQKGPRVLRGLTPKGDE